MMEEDDRLAELEFEVVKLKRQLDKHKEVINQHRDILLALQHATGTYLND